MNQTEMVRENTIEILAKGPERAVDAGLSLDIARRVAGRLKSEMGRVIHERFGSGIIAADLARHLTLNHQLCYKLLVALRSTGDAAQALRVFPGTEGITQVLQALAKSIPADKLLGPQAALEDYVNLLRQAGGSQRKLIAWLEHQGEPTESQGEIASDIVRTRQLFFESAAAMRGQWAEFTANIQIAHPTPGDTQTMMKAFAMAKIGIHRASHSMPIVSKVIITPDEQRDGRIDLQPTPGSREVYARFSSNPLPPIVPRVQGHSALVCFDPDRTLQGPIDIVIGPFYSQGLLLPSASPARTHNTSSTISLPTRRMVKDVYMHRTIAAGLVPQAGAFVVGSEGMLMGDPASRWYDRFPGTIEIRLLGRGLGQAACEHYARHAELTACLFESTGWNPEDFVGYRCNIEYPICYAQYVMSFEDLVQ
jgi:hypothetical protein